MRDQWFKIGGIVVPLSQIKDIDFRQMHDLRAVVCLINDQQISITGIEAIELAMQTKPSVLEDKRLTYARHAWAIHNLVAHPVMQLLAFFKLYKWAFWIHDVTVPKPKV